MGLLFESASLSSTHIRCTLMSPADITLFSFIPKDVKIVANNSTRFKHSKLHEKITSANDMLVKRIINNNRELLQWTPRLTFFSGHIFHNPYFFRLSGAQRDLSKQMAFHVYAFFRT